MNAPAPFDTRIDDPVGDDEEVTSVVRYEITSYGADMLVDGIVKRMDDGAIFIPEFQRNFVWTKPQASRFIESLLLGLPVPGIFLFREPESRKLMVVDGQQRLKSLQQYYTGMFRNAPFGLVGVSEDLAGRTYQELAPEDRRDLDDSIIHATIFQQDGPEDRSSVYSVFERLNTGGTPLHPQEIRACVYGGVLSKLLADLARNEHWLEVYRSQSPRKKDEEIILRFLALYCDFDSYERPMKQFLNNFMEKHRDPHDDLCKRFRSVFEATMATVANMLGPEALRPKGVLNVSVADAVLVGIAHRLDRGPINSAQALRDANERLIDAMGREELYRIGTTDKERVERRVALALQEYDSVP